MGVVERVELAKAQFENALLALNSPRPTRMNSETSKAVAIRVSVPMLFISLAFLGSPVDDVPYCLQDLFDGTELNR